MVRILECQANRFRIYNAEYLRLFAIALICSLLDTFEVDLTSSELNDIEQFAKDWYRE